MGKREKENIREREGGGGQRELEKWRRRENRR